MAENSFWKTRLIEHDLGSGTLSLSSNLTTEWVRDPRLAGRQAWTIRWFGTSTIFRPTIKPPNMKKRLPRFAADISCQPVLKAGKLL